MKSLEISRYTKLLLKQGTLWENGRLTNEGIQPADKIQFFYTKRIIILLFSIVLILCLPSGFSVEFLGYLISGLSIFIGLFINIIIVLYQRFISINISAINSPPNRNNKALSETKKNFIRQFTFVTGKNLLISTLIIIGSAFSILFQNFFSVDISNFELIKDTSKWTIYSFYTGIYVWILFFFRLVIIYLLIDFFLLLLYSIGSLFAFLKGEY